MMQTAEPSTSPPCYSWQRLDDFTPRALHALLQARVAVFVVEQNCPYQELDDYDLDAWHLQVHCNGQLAACARVLPPGSKFAQASIGRVLVLPAFRAQKLGHGLMAEALRFSLSQHPGSGVALSAQAHLQGFYGAWGFVASSEVYWEDGIPHVDMLRPAKS
ncbi:GNAT family N-acetyltransferase [Curvibacter sp. CHRR-16]|uniref:GNAT family N-acetyltransferase n=1 Tax=Curvibacter sp. CHRR-16 TaxID=2835872 RepID=UPI001BDAA3B3|nr:GNAT family N-acetyltransferase [Curvibacter sp. CHRR-16]MBT0571802.1 GNAT family N-acetyltransferase [Curvibacter sp. CHRR-16]